MAGVANRVHPDFGSGTAAEARAAAAAASGDLAALWHNVAELRALVEAARDELAPLAARLADAPLVTVPLLAGDVHDVAGLEQIRAHVFDAP
jgi:hypothetical protein